MSAPLSPCLRRHGGTPIDDARGRHKQMTLANEAGLLIATGGTSYLIR